MTLLQIWLLSKYSVFTLFSFCSCGFQVRVIADKESNKPRGYAFIEYVHTRDMKGIIHFNSSFHSICFSVCFYNLMHNIQLPINKLMGGRLMVEGFLWMLSVVELSQIGVLDDLGVDQELLELEVKMLIRDIQEGKSLNFCSSMQLRFCLIVSCFIA